MSDNPPTVANPPPAAANDNRPATFDANLMAYYPGMRNLARRYVPRQYREDLVTDTIMDCLEHWDLFRADGSFWGWITWRMRGLVSHQAQAAKRRRKMVMISEGPAYQKAVVPASQQDYTELSIVLSKLSGTRDSDVLMRLAMGSTLIEAGHDMGISPERVRQLAERERGRLVAGGAHA